MKLNEKKKRKKKEEVKMNHFFSFVKVNSTILSF